MSLVITMQDIMIQKRIDEDFNGALVALNNAGMEKKNFIVMDGENGNKVMLNIPNIMTVEEDKD